VARCSILLLKASDPISQDTHDAVDIPTTGTMKKGGEESALFHISASPLPCS
jgi:hypothetical protein